MASLYSVNKTTHLIPALENLQSSESCYNYLNIYSFLFYYAAFSISLGPGCCRTSSQTSRPGERRDGRGTCKCCLWKVGIHQITHKALNMLLMLPREVLFCSQQPSGLDKTTCTHMTSFIEISTSLSEFLAVHNTIIMYGQSHNYSLFKFKFAGQAFRMRNGAWRQELPNWRKSWKRSKATSRQWVTA